MLDHLVPLHRGFDDLLGTGPQGRQAFRLNEQFDITRDAWAASDECSALEGQDHLVDRGRGDMEVALQVGLGGRTAHHQRVGVDEGQILALLFGEAMRADAARSA